MVVAMHFACSMARYLAGGFAAAGHEVVTVGPAAGRFMPWSGGMELAEEFVWTPTLALPANAPTTIADVLSAVGHVDLIVHGDSAYHLTGDSPVPNVLFAVDNHCREYSEREYDLIFGAHSWGFRHEENRFRWLPCAYDPHEHYEWQTDSGGRVVDVGFVGVLYTNRLAVLQTLRSWGLSVLTATGKVYHESNDLYNVCKIALCVSACGDVPARVFEGLAQGCIVLADNQFDLAKLGLESGKQLLTFSNPDELSMAVAIALSSEGQAIAEAGKAWVAEHNWKARAEEMIRETFA